MDAIRKTVNDLTDELIALRRDFHAHPELGFEEHRTAAQVERYLNQLGLETKRVTQTGVVALLQGSQPGPVLMLRADMDALPVCEETDVDYQSTCEGVMHACGHDAHIAMLLIAVKILQQNRDALAGTIKFVFQPNEEIAGALPMIRDGVLENPKVDAVMGMHVWSPLKSGVIAISEGGVMGALDVFKITIQGCGGHTGAPEDAVDPVICAANVILTTQMVQTREISNLKSTVIIFGKIQGGSKSNIIPNEVTLEGSIRFLYQGGPDSEEQPTQRFERIVRGVCATHRCNCDITIEHENISLINDKNMVALARQTAKQVFEDERLIVENRSLASEDFSEFSARVPGVFMFLGSGDPDLKTDIPHHNPCFNVDESVLPKGVEMFVRGALNYFDLCG